LTPRANGKGLTIRLARQIDRDGFAALNALPTIGDRRRIKEW
jgi:hypothetical protein